jgi:MFS family permease
MAAGSWLFLLKERAFLPLFLTQFFSAFNDNAFKLAMLTLISYHLGYTQTESEYYQALAGALFIIPFFLFSATAGQLADKYNKAVLSRYVKIFEVLLMILGGVALYQGSVFLMMSTLTGMGIHATFFGPIKYAILPDHLPAKYLLSATALIEASTFMAVLLGTTMGTLAIGNSKTNVIYAILMTNFVALFGLLSSFFIPDAFGKLKFLTIDWNVFRATKVLIKDVAVNKVIFPSILAISWFWFIGAVILTKLPDYTHFVLNANASVFALFLALFSIGIALGSFLISQLMRGAITLKYVPLSMLTLSIFALDIYLATPSYSSEKTLMNLGQFLSSFNNIRITADFFLFSCIGGLFVVPLYTYLQVSSEEGKRARIIAANNIYNALFMVIGSVMIMVMLKFTENIAIIFLLLAILNAIASLSLYGLLRLGGSQPIPNR